MTHQPILPTISVVSRLISEVTLISSERIEGYVFDPERLDARFVVELYMDGQPAALMRAELYDDRLRDRGVGDGCYRFVFSVARLSFRLPSSLEVRLANSGRSLGAPVPVAAHRIAASSGPGEVRWDGGLAFSGWLSDESSRQAPEVRAFVDGNCVAFGKALQWTHRDDGGEAKAVRGFELCLPTEFADGRVRRAAFIDDLGRPLLGSPMAFFGFEDRLAALLDERAEIASEKIRGRLYDQCFPQSLPFDAFAAWSDAFPVRPGAARPAPKLAVALVGDGEADASVASLQKQLDVDWIAAVFCAENQFSFDNRQLLEFLDGDASRCDFVIFALSGTVFRERALAGLIEAFALHPQASIAYCDVTIAAEDGRDWPIAFPGFDYERVLEQGYCAYLFASPIARAREAALSGAANLFRIFHAALDRWPIAPNPADKMGAAPVHVPGFLARIPRIDLAEGATELAQATGDHLRRQGVAAIVEPGRGDLFPCARIKRAIRAAKVSFLVATRDRVDLLRPCLDSLKRTVSLDEHEAIVIDNDTSDPETSRYLEAIASRGVKVIFRPGRFNFARLIGEAAAWATGEFLVVMSNDVEALEPGWLEEMLGRAADPGVGAVGPVLLWPSGVVQHGGVVLGVRFAASPAFGERMDGDPGYADQLIVAHECSAVSGACLLTPRRLFLDAGGFDAVRFPLLYADIDYCLRLRAGGLRVVIAPRAKLRRRNPADALQQQAPDALAARELASLRSRWGEALLDDPCYSPLLSLDGAPYSRLAWPPRRLTPRLPVWPSPRPIPPGF